MTKNIIPSGGSVNITGGPWVLTAIVVDGTTETATFTDPDEMSAWVAKRNGKLNLYYMVNDPKRPLTSKAKKTDVAAMRALHVDVDDPSPEALARIQAHDPPPSVIVFSGNGYNALWKLRGLVPVTPENIDELESYNRGLIERLNGDPACFNIDRILRLPFTWNLPTKTKRAAGKVRVMSKIIEITDRKYSLSEFEPSRGAHQATSAVVSGVNTPTLPEVLPEVDLVKLRVDMRWMIIIRRGYDPGDPDLWPSRSEATFAVTCVLVRAGVEDAMIAAVLLDPNLDISEHCLAQPKYRQREYVARQIQRAKDKVND